MNHKKVAVVALLSVILVGLGVFSHHLSTNQGVLTEEDVPAEEGIITNQGATTEEYIKEFTGLDLTGKCSSVESESGYNTGYKTYRHCILPEYIDEIKAYIDVHWASAQIQMRSYRGAATPFMQEIDMYSEYGSQYAFVPETNLDITEFAVVVIDKDGEMILYFGPLP